MSTSLWLVSAGRNGLLACALIVAVPTALQAGLIGLSSDTPGTVYSIDSSTGLATPLVNVSGVTNTVNVGLEYMNGTLYATNVVVGGQRSFGSIDLTTGAFTLLNTQGGFNGMYGLAGDPDAGLLYSVVLDQLGMPLWSMTPTGTITPIGNVGQPIVGLAYDNNSDVLYGVSPSSLFTIDMLTGAATLVGATGISMSMPGLAYDTDANILYMNNGASIDPNGAKLYTLNTSTGAATLVGSNLSTGSIEGLAYVPENVVPEPGSLVLCLTGGLTLAAFGRRRLSARFMRNRGH